jgi:beta-lactamase regulating signal transducer with metallopeptidase domain
MATELLLAVIRAHIAASVAVLLVLALRAPARRLFGAERAYGLWLIVPAAMLGALFTWSVPRQAGGGLSGGARLWLARDGHFNALVIVWAGGLALALGLVALRQWRFEIAARAGRGGPAAVGVIHARLVLPADFTERFDPEERRLVLAHERAHIARLDARATALMVLIQCVGWFNPLLHLAAGAMRVDQELACDAAVIAERPRERRRYAETLLKSQLASSAPLLGCRWSGRAAHPLATRIAALSRPPPSPLRRILGLAAVGLLAAAALASARAAQPEQPPWPAVLMTLPMTVLLDLDPGPQPHPTR